MLRIITNILRLPVDLVLFTIDFFLFSAWLAAALTRAISGFHGTPGICRRAHLIEIRKRERWLCPPARKYGNTWLLKILCPWCKGEVSHDDLPVCLCKRKAPFQVFLVGYLFTGASLVAFWGTAFYFAGYWVTHHLPELLVVILQGG